MKQIFILSSLGLISLIVVLIYFNPFEPAIEEMYKTSFYASFFVIFIAFFVKYRLMIFTGNFWRFIFAMFFVISISSGIGIVIRTALTDRISYLGFTLIVFSLFFIILVPSKKKK
ncbi:MAG: hypothetical protein ACOCUV_01705 [bacterium]